MPKIILQLNQKKNISQYGTKNITNKDLIKQNFHIFVVDFQNMINLKLLKVFITSWVHIVLVLKTTVLFFEQKHKTEYSNYGMVKIFIHKKIMMVNFLIYQNLKRQ